MSDLVKRLKARTRKVHSTVFSKDVPDEFCREAAARITELEAALAQARDWFQQYADSHTAKGDTDKAKRNQDRADFCARAALAGQGDSHD